MSDNTVRLEKLTDIQQLSCWISFYCCICGTKERVGYSLAVAWPADTKSYSEADCIRFGKMKGSGPAGIRHLTDLLMC